MLAVGAEFSQEAWRLLYVNDRKIGEDVLVELSDYVVMRTRLLVTEYLTVE